MDKSFFFVDTQDGVGTYVTATAYFVHNTGFCLRLSDRREINSMEIGARYRMFATQDEFEAYQDRVASTGMSLIEKLAPRHTGVDCTDDNLINAGRHAGDVNCLRCTLLSARNQHVE